MSEEKKLPELSELYKEDLLDIIGKESALLILLNHNPPSVWIKEHPYAGVPYIPIDKIEYLLTKIFRKWWVEIKNTQLIANSVAVTVRLFYINPITGVTEWQDGIGAQPLQTDKGAGATDFNAVKSNAVQLALPSAESYAIKDAAEKLGKLFGKDINRKDTLSYEKMLVNDIVSIELRASKVFGDDKTGDTQ